MGKSGFGVRLFEIEADGSLEPLLGVDNEHFGGTAPNVGDTYAMWGPKDTYRFYSVQRRYFIDSPDGDNGWCVIVRRMDSAPQLERVVEAWADDTKFWRDIDEEERQEEDAERASRARDLQDKLSGKPAASPEPKKPQPKGKAKPKKPRKRVLKPQPE